MKTLLFTMCVVAIVAAHPRAFSQETGTETRVRLQDLPVPVQDAVKAHAKGAPLRGVSKEVKNGRTLYEAELRTNGRTRDITFDATGQVVSDEEQTSLAQVPDAARATIQKAAAGGKLTLMWLPPLGGSWLTWSRSGSSA
jgi:hypothetical protein